MTWGSWTSPWPSHHHNGGSDQVIHESNLDLRLEQRNATQETSPVNIPDTRHYLAEAAEVTFQSGLPLYWRRHRPVAAEPSLGRTVQLGVKRCLDVVLGAVALVALSPTLLFLMVMIKLTSPGPIFYTQLRHGRDSRPFTVYKFRSMREDACDLAGVRQAVMGDDRVTPIGRMMRTSSLDELPQLINIIRGDMSLIGPRPHPIGMRSAGQPYEQLVSWYADRHTMRPGLSGWAQANGLRGPTEDAIRARARVEHDLAYIQNFSIFLDLRIIWLTLVKEVFRRTGI